jgi:hypothetical protein
LLGTLLLGKERYDEAIGQFELADAVGAGFQNHFFAAAYAAQRKFADARAVLARGIDPDPDRRDVADYSFRALLDADQGDWPRARRGLAEGIDAMAAGPARPRHMLASIELASRMIELPASQRLPAVDRFLRAQRETQTDTVDPGARIDHQRRLLLAAWMAAREVDGVATAQAALGQIDDDVRAGEYPELAQRLVLAEAELARREGNGADAVARLRAMVDGNEFYVVHVALMDALSGEGEHRAARDEARWLAMHRGRAYSEMHGDYMLQLFNVVQSNLAWLAVAEFSLRLDDDAAARDALLRFDAQWPADGQPLSIRQRARAVRERLADPAGGADNAPAPAEATP